MNAASIELQLVEGLVRRARQLISIECYTEASRVLDFLQAQLHYGMCRSEGWHETDN